MHAYQCLRYGLKTGLRARFEMSSTLSADIHVRHEEIDEQKIFEDLPFHLRAEVAATLTKSLLKHSHVRQLLLHS